MIEGIFVTADTDVSNFPWLFKQKPHDCAFLRPPMIYSDLSTDEKHSRRINSVLDACVCVCVFVCASLYCYAVV